MNDSVLFQGSPQLKLINDEFHRAIEKFPSFNSAHEGYAVILEELDELWEIVKLKQSTVGRDDLLRKEAVQVGAMALRFLVDMDRFKN